MLWNESCNMTAPLTCDTRFRFMLRPFRAPVETAPNTGFPYFTPSKSTISPTSVWDWSNYQSFPHWPWAGTWNKLHWENNLHWDLQHVRSWIWHELQTAVLWELLWSKLYHILWSSGGSVHLWQQREGCLYPRQPRSYKILYWVSPWSRSVNQLHRVSTRLWFINKLFWLSSWSR